MDFSLPRRFFSLSLILLFILFSSLSNAKTVDGLYLSFGSGLLQFDYRETKAGNTLNEERGILPLFSIESCASKKAIQLCTGYQVASETVKYDGQTQSGIPVETDTKMRLQKINGSINTDFLIGRQLFNNWNKTGDSSLPISMTLKYDYWRWDRDIQSTSGAFGLSEDYFWHEIGVKVEIPLAQSKHTQSFFSTELFRILKPEIDVHLPYYNAGTINLPLHSKNGVEITWSTDVFHSRRVDSNNENKPWLNIKAFAKYYQFGSSEPKTILIGNSIGTITEPDSRTYLYGVSLTLYLHSRL